MIDPLLEGDIRKALDSGDLEGATDLAVRGYGPQVLGYLRAILRSEPDASEVFSIFCEFLWTGLPKFRGEASFLTWAYQLAWAAGRRFREDPFRLRASRLSTPAMNDLAAQVYSTTASHLKPENKDRLAVLRERLDPAEQTLLVLRLDRELSWSEIAQVFDEPGLSEAALRKRFERLKERIKELAEADGLLDAAE
jgi:RNA polymerase sigma-70 factor (ECF subfamily)